MFRVLIIAIVTVFIFLNTSAKAQSGSQFGRNVIRERNISQDEVCFFGVNASHLKIISQKGEKNCGHFTVYYHDIGIIDEGSIDQSVRRVNIDETNFFISCSGDKVLVSFD